MTPRAVGILLACGAVALAGGWYFSTGPEPAGQAAAGGQLAFPDLAAKLRNASKIEITHQDRRTVIERRPSGAGWGLAALHDYPVQDSKLRGLLTGLTELRLMEPRTSDAAAFGRLGVEDPSGASASGDLVRVLDAAGKPIAGIIVGHRKVRSRGDLPDQVYVRRPGETQSWLAEGTLQADADPSGWVDHTLMNVAHDRIASVVVGDKTLVFGRIAERFTLVEPGEHVTLDEAKVDAVARALETLSFQQVRADADAPKDTSGGEPGRAVFTTRDGLAVSVTLLHADKAVWARFSAAGTGATQAEAAALNARLSGWSYEIGSWKENALVPTLNDLKAAEPAAPAGAPAPAEAVPDTAPQAGPGAR